VKNWLLIELEHRQGGIQQWASREERKRSWVRLGNAEGTRAGYPLASESISSIFRLLFPLLNLLGKQIEAESAGGLIEIDILAITFIAAHKQLV
jgi:hypothetical protein